MANQTWKDVNNMFGIDMTRYGAEIWILGKEEKSRMEASETWMWRSMETVKWQDKVGNEEILRRV